MSRCLNYQFNPRQITIQLYVNEVQQVFGFLASLFLDRKSVYSIWRVSSHCTGRNGVHSTFDWSVWSKLALNLNPETQNLKKYKLNLWTRTLNSKTHHHLQGIGERFQKCNSELHFARGRRRSPSFVCTRNLTYWAQKLNSWNLTLILGSLERHCKTDVQIYVICHYEVKKVQISIL